MRKSIIKDALFFLLLAAVVLTAAVGVQKACFSKEKFKNLSYSWELSLKKIAKGLIEQDAEVVKNSYLNETAEKIIARLTSHLEKNPYKIEVLIVNDPMVNAFAFPGGLLVVYSGIIKKMDSAEDFAALLAHESAHVIHRDSLKALVRQLGLGSLLAIG
ncbi:MAG: M48 family metalloprotease, partial [Candidatus Aminicenantes bacterium]|nr:M48 family metalloprotease [Candidatus Aminicenantes bacterium]